ncbi:hypothetical protein PRUPE_4G039500 [Prunus persica]|uniref:Secretory carrier-associated membrane protein n=1 Tax=Prunus persica TaxID=3760 RepID=A0A251PFF9_PRUPE|nr:hypothetical protein PRUPE_4G039500 [Prunus persica]
MAGRYDSNPFAEEDEVNPFSNPGSVAPAKNSRLSPLPPERAGFNYGLGDTVDIPIDGNADLKKRERELQAKETELRKREEIVKRKEDAAARAGIVLEEKNWPAFFPIIHHDIANEIPIHLQRVQYVAFTTWLGIVLCLFWNIIAVTTAWIKGEGEGKNLVPCCYLLHSRGSWILCLVVPTTVPSFQVRECFEVWMVFHVLFAPHWLLHLCCCCASTNFQRKISHWHSGCS